MGHPCCRREPRERGSQRAGFPCPNGLLGDHRGPCGQEGVRNRSLGRWAAGEAFGADGCRARARSALSPGIAASREPGSERSRRQRDSHRSETSDARARSQRGRLRRGGRSTVRRKPGGGGGRARHGTFAEPAPAEEPGRRVAVDCSVADPRSNRASWWRRQGACPGARHGRSDEQDGGFKGG